MPAQLWTININGSREIVVEIVDLPGVEVEGARPGHAELEDLQRVVI